MKNNFIVKNNSTQKILLLQIMLAILLLFISIIVMTTNVKAETTQPYYTYTFKYLEEYYYEKGKEYFGDNVIINATNDIINKNENGWAVNDIIVDYKNQGSFVSNYGEFSNKYYLIWKERSIRVPAGKQPEISSLRSNFNCFYNIFKYWNASGKAYQTANLPEAKSNITFTAFYEIKQKIKLEADDQSLLNYYPKETAEIELTSRNVDGQTVYEYTFDYNAMYKKTEGYYKYLLIKNGTDIGNGKVKISPINVNQNDLVFNLTTLKFKDQNDFNATRSQYTGKRYKGDFWLSLGDTINALTGYGGILDNTAKTISSTATISKETSSLIATGTAGIADSIWVFSDILSNVKVTLVYLFTIFIACFLTFLILTFIFWLIRKVITLAKKGVNNNG